MVKKFPTFANKQYEYSCPACKVRRYVQGKFKWKQKSNVLGTHFENFSPPVQASCERGHCKQRD